MNVTESLNEKRAAEHLADLLEGMSSVRSVEILHQAAASDTGIDILATFVRGKSRHSLIVEVKRNAEPARVRQALWQLEKATTTYGEKAYPILAAPYISPASQQICRDSGVGYLDFVGNAYLAVGGLEIDHRTDAKPKVEERALRSLFKPKAAAILHVMLGAPEHRWRVGELAEKAGVSAGHASQVGQQLRQREWAEQSSEGLWLSDPGALLDSWQDEYDVPAGEHVQLYTHLHGAELQEAARSIIGDIPRANVLFASFSAAEWIAPYARTGRTYFYADEHGLGELYTRLDLRSAPKGANIDIRVPNDGVVFQARTILENGLQITNPIQTYLDLTTAGERGREAAAHLREEALQW